MALNTRNLYRGAKKVHSFQFEEKGEKTTKNEGSERNRGRATQKGEKGGFFSDSL